MIRFIHKHFGITKMVILVMKMTKLTSPLPKCEHTQGLQTGHRWKYLSPTIRLRPPLLPLTFVMLYLLLKLPFLHAYIFVSIHSDVGVSHTWDSIWNRGGSLSGSLSVHAEYWADFLLQPFQQFELKWITWSATQTSQRAPSPSSSWEQIYSLKIQS